jgi:hypothetical protein
VFPRATGCGTNTDTNSVVVQGLTCFRSGLSIAYTCDLEHLLLFLLLSSHFLHVSPPIRRTLFSLLILLSRSTRRPRCSPRAPAPGRLLAAQPLRHPGRHRPPPSAAPTATAAAAAASRRHLRSPPSRPRSSLAPTVGLRCPISRALAAWPRRPSDRLLRRAGLPPLALPPCPAEYHTLQ